MGEIAVSAKGLASSERDESQSEVKPRSPPASMKNVIANSAKLQAILAVNAAGE
jgi:hypothetical protein